jgi:IS1 family transposase/lambda repressor-like predicted transcriptional regulator
MEKAVLILHLLVEGSSVRSVERITGIGKATILRLLNFAGAKCESLISDPIRNVPMDVLRPMRYGHSLPRKRAVGAFRMLVMTRSEMPTHSWASTRSQNSSPASFSGVAIFPLQIRFIDKLHRAVAGRFQLTTDGFRPYVEAVEEVFGTEIDFAQLVKQYRSDSGGRADRRYSPGDFVSATKSPIIGHPDRDRVSTSYVERQNLTMRMMMRRLTRLTNAFSKKWEHLEKALALHFAFYNFCRVHQTLRVTPAMEAGITDHIWTLRTAC